MKAEEIRFDFGTEDGSWGTQLVVKLSGCGFTARRAFHVAGLQPVGLAFVTGFEPLDGLDRGEIEHPRFIDFHLEPPRLPNWRSC